MALRKLSTRLIVHVSMAMRISYQNVPEHMRKQMSLLTEALFSELSTFIRQLDTKVVPINVSSLFLAFFLGNLRKHDGEYKKASI